MHTSTYGAGEIRGQLYAQTYRFTADLNGAQQAPTPVQTPARGVGFVTITPPNGANPPMLTYSLYWWGLSGDTNGVHFHQAWMGQSNPNPFIFMTSQVQPATGNAMFGWVPQASRALTIPEYNWFLSGQVYL